MALRRTIAKRLFHQIGETSPLVTLEHSPILSPSLPKSLAPLNAAKTNFHREFMSSPDYSDGGFFRRFLQRRTINQAARLPEFLSIPVGDKLREKLRSMNVTGERLRLEGLATPAPPQPPAKAGPFDGISVDDAKKILRSSQLEKLRSALRQIPMNSISHSEYVETCVDVCSNRDQGVEFAEKLDECGNVIVLGNVVFLRPEQIAKSMEKVISESMVNQDDPRRRELERMENQKAAIDQKAQQLVRRELYFGLGFLALQTLGFMRLTFWELSWDVMEPICFFVTSMDFGLAYAFFLRTSKEPNFSGYFQHRFKVKQKQLMRTHNFDVERFNELCRVFYPNYRNPSTSCGHFGGSDHAGGAVFGAIHS